MKFECILQRIAEFNSVIKPNVSKVESSTIGIFEVFNEKKELVFKSFCVENGGESTDTPNQDKRIVARDYLLKWSPTTITIPPKYRTKSNISKAGKAKEEFLDKGLLLYTNEIPSFEKRRILIHIGNYPQDTEGCLLLCKYWNKKSGFANNSTLAVCEFYDLVANFGAENFTLTIKEIK